MDADCWPDLGFNPKSILRKNRVWVGAGGEGRYGQFLMSCDTFWGVGGFNEYMRGWGFKDLRFRLHSHQQTDLSEFDDSLIGVLEHGDSERMSVRGLCSRERGLAALRASRLRNRLVAAHCPWGCHSPELSHDRSQFFHRCASTSSLVLLANVVELFLEYLLPSGDQERWPMGSLPLLHGWGF